MHPESRQPNAMDRRSFLGVASVAVGAALIPPVAAAQHVKRSPQRGRAKNLIIAVPDGVSTGAISIMDLARRERDGVGSRWLALMNEPGTRTALVSTVPAVGVRTDSAAAATAWSIGERVNNSAICTTPDGRTPTPLFVRAKASGRRVGLVTTASLTDATPAAFMCNALSRGEQPLMATQLLDRGLDLGIGGGAKYVDLPEWQRRGVMCVSAASEARKAATTSLDRPMVALLDDGYLPHALDRTPDDLTQREAARLALERLADSPNGFCLVFENENTDEASHANDAASLVHDLLDFEEGLGVLIEFAQSRDDTLLIVTTDHAGANPGILTNGPKGTEQLHLLLGSQHSFKWIRNEFRAMPESDRTAEQLAWLMQEASGVELTESDVRFLRGALFGDQADPFRMASGLTSVMGSVMANHLGVAFAGPDHTTDLVIATAIGPGSEQLPAHGHHTDLHRVMVDALGLD